MVTQAIVCGVKVGEAQSVRGGWFAVTLGRRFRLRGGHFLSSLVLPSQETDGARYFCQGSQTASSG
jgi:hypothetical protein